MMPDGDVEVCVDCGASPDLTPVADCPGPHPDLAAFESRTLTRLTWENWAALAVTVGILTAVWGVVIGSGWVLWGLIR